MSGWYKFTNAMHAANKKDDVTKICVVGKYTQLPDAYLSIIEALHHSGVYDGRHMDIELIDGEELTEDNIEEVLGGADGILVPGGFGLRGIEGKIAAAHRARDAQRSRTWASAWACRWPSASLPATCADMPGASSTEFADAALRPTLRHRPHARPGGRRPTRAALCAWAPTPARSRPARCAEEAYGESLVYERHRHRFEVNNAFRDAACTRAGLVISGLSPDERLVEMVELPEDVHPWFVASQAHPEFKSRPTKPAPLFREFVRASIARHEGCDRHEVEPEA